MAERIGEIGMNAAKESDRPTIAEDPFQKEISAVPGGREAIAVRQMDSSTPDLHGERFPMHLHPGDFLENASRPPVVVAPQKRNGNTGVDDVADLTKHANVSPRHDVCVLEPEVEKIAEDEQALGLALCDVAEEGDESGQSRLVVAGIGRGAQVSVGNEKDRSLHGVLGCAFRAETSNGSSKPASEGNFRASLGYPPATSHAGSNGADRREAAGTVDARRRTR
jgi:hypothetical protein